MRNNSELGGFIKATKPVKKAKPPRHKRWKDTAEGRDRADQRKEGRSYE